MFAAFPYHTFDSGNEAGLSRGRRPRTSRRRSRAERHPGIRVELPAALLPSRTLQPETWVAAPAAFLGNQSDMYGKSLSYDIQIRTTDNVAYPTAAITGGGLSLIFTNGVPPLNAWQTRQVSFNENLWHVASASGAVATQAQLKSVLENLTGLYLLIEWHTGSDDTSIDNVGVTNATTMLPGDFNDDHTVDGWTTRCGGTILATRTRPTSTTTATVATLAKATSTCGSSTMAIPAPVAGWPPTRCTCSRVVPIHTPRICRNPWSVSNSATPQPRRIDARHFVAPRPAGRLCPPLHATVLSQSMADIIPAHPFLTSGLYPGSRLSRSPTPAPCKISEVTK